MVALQLKYESNWAESYIYVNRLYRPFFWESLRDFIFSRPNDDSRYLQRTALKLLEFLDDYVKLLLKILWLAFSFNRLDLQIFRELFCWICSSKCFILARERERPFSASTSKCTFFSKIDINAGSSLTSGELLIGTSEAVILALRSFVICESGAIACLSREAPLFFLDRKSFLCFFLSPLRPWSSMWRLLGYWYNC